MAASASVGLIQIWDIMEGIAEIDKYTDSSDDFIRAGGFMAMGILNSGIQNEFDPVFALLSEQLENDSREIVKIGALMGLSFTYAGTCREDILEIVSPLVLASDRTIELNSVAALCLGMVFVGTC